MNEEELEQLREDVNMLISRVSYLEDELDVSIEREQFRRFAEHLTDNEVEVEENHFGMVARFAANERNIEQTIRKINGKDGYYWHIYSSEDGTLMMEVGKGER